MPKIYRLLRLGGVRAADIIVRRGKDARLPMVHAVDRNIEMARLAQDAPCPMPEIIERGTYLEVREKDRIQCEQWLSSRGIYSAPIVIQPGYSRTFKGKRTDERKFWPIEHWIQLLKQLLAENPGVHIIINGAPSEALLVNEISCLCGDQRVFSAAQDMTVGKLVALLSKARACIGVDTGPAHIAAAVGCPLVVMFGGVPPQLMAPLSLGSPVIVVVAPCADLECQDENDWAASHSMLDISVENVLEAVHNLLTRTVEKVNSKKLREL
jgi:heptosyltransferase-2/heptosyltransferase-3